MNISKSEIKNQFDRALKFGWLPHFSAAVLSHTPGFFDEADLLAVASRETNLDPKWLTKAGDKGNGFGLMQADRRSFPEFTRGDGWKDAKTGILFGARVLMMKWKDTERCMGERVTVRSSKGGFYDFIGKKLAPAELQTVSISAYNCGRWAHYCISTGRKVDQFSTGGDYSSDVQARAAEFRRLFAEWSAKTTAQSLAATATVQPTDNAAESTAEPVALTPTEDAENAKIKDFSDKYLKHCKNDSVKNILAVVGVRATSSVSTVWAIGLSGKIALILTLAAILGFSAYALVYYRKRIFGWVKTIFDSLFNS
jgi:hypothetical protein